MTKHLCFSFQPTDRIFSEALYVFPLESGTPFAVLQSRIHEFWTRLLSSSMKTDLRYAASDCFETFPFPAEDPRAVIPELEALGEKLDQARAEYMVSTNQGLTKTYNALKDPSCTDERIRQLRALHEEMDRALLASYPRLDDVPSASQKLPAAAQGTSGNSNAPGWSDIPVPPYCIATDEDRAALQAFEDEIIDRLFVLNELRAKKEAALGKGAGKKGKKKTNKASKAASKSSTGKKNPASKSEGSDQGSLF